MVSAVTQTHTSSEICQHHNIRWDSGQDADVLSLSSASVISRREIASLLWTTVVWRRRAGGEVDLSAAVTVKRGLL